MNEFSIKENINKELERINHLNENLKEYHKNNSNILNEILITNGMYDLKYKLQTNITYIDMYNRQIEAAKNAIKNICDHTSIIIEHINHYEEQMYVAMMYNDANMLNEDGFLTDSELTLICNYADKSDYTKLDQCRWVDLEKIINVVREIKTNYEGYELTNIFCDDFKQLTQNLKNKDGNNILYYQYTYRFIFTKNCKSFEHIFRPFE